MYLSIPDDLESIDDNSYYVIVVEDDSVSGVALGTYIKENQKQFAGKQLTYVPNEQAESIMWNL